MKLRSLTTILLLLAIAGCKKSPDAPLQSFNATVNGNSFSANTIKATLSGSDLYVHGLESADNGFIIEVPMFTTADSTYTIESSAAFASYNTSTTNSFGIHGAVTVHLNGTTGATGTFYFTCSDSTRVTNGNFKVLF